MIIKHKEIEINEKDPFLNCKLGRRQFADILTSIVSSYADGFVLAINNPWGTGKTTFLKMWESSLKKDHLKTVYFNAWQHDFDKDPMVAIMGELMGITNDRNTLAWKSTLQKGGEIFKKVVPAAFKGFAKKYLGEDAVNLVDAGTEGAMEVLKAEIDDYAKRKKGLQEFRASLQNYVRENSVDQPLIFLIDELDRCRPDYAVEMLEQLKHFFNVQGIVFVLAIDKPQLLNSIRGFYGNAEIDAEEYLRRFIDIEYSIPQPDAKQYCDYLYQYFQFNEFFFSESRSKELELKDDAKTFIEFSKLLVEHHKLTLRQQEKLFAHARLVLRSFKSNNYNFPALFIVLVYLRAFEKKFYEQLKRLEFSVQEMIDELYAHLPKDKTRYTSFSFRAVESLLAFTYLNSYREKYPDLDLNGVDLKSAFPEEKLAETLQYRFDFYRQRYDRVGLDFLLKRIDLLQELIA